MPILVDFSTIAVGNSMANLLKEIENQDPSLVNLIRHQVLNSLRSINKKYRNEYGELIICFDSPPYWRKEYFPFYKGNRKKNPKIDWALLFSFVNQIKQELIDHFPFKTIQVKSAEADDVIAALTIYFSTNEEFLVNSNSFIEEYKPVLICASDNDFMQLGEWKNVQQFSLRTKKILPKIRDIEKHLVEKCLRGETGDGIPNVLSEDNCLVDKIKQKSITTKFVDEILNTLVIPEHLKRNYDRNRTLIDFARIPESLGNEIEHKYNISVPNGNEGKMFEFFMKMKLMQHLDNINDFKVVKQ